MTSRDKQRKLAPLHYSTSPAQRAEQEQRDAVKAARKAENLANEARIHAQAALRRLQLAQAATQRHTAELAAEREALAMQRAALEPAAKDTTPQPSSSPPHEALAKSPKPSPAAKRHMAGVEAIEASADLAEILDHAPTTLHPELVEAATRAFSAAWRSVPKPPPAFQGSPFSLATGFACQALQEHTSLLELDTTTQPARLRFIPDARPDSDEPAGSYNTLYPGRDLQHVIAQLQRLAAARGTNPQEPLRQT